MRSVKILFCLLGDRNKASSRVRGYWVAEELEKNGFKCSIVSGSGRFKLMRCLALLPNYDVIFFQKNTSKWHVKLLSIANSLGKTTLFDIDDAPSRINRAVTLNNAIKMISGASTVLVGSRNLLEYAKKYQTNTFLFPTSVKLQNYVPTIKTKEDETVCLGWIGNGEQYAQDLVKILSGPLRIVGSKMRVKFKLVGACGNRTLYDCFCAIPGVESELIDQIPWNDPAAVRKQLGDMDIGLYPMLDNEFNLYKCAFKALEYMAMQIPVIASPVGALSDIINYGKNGFLANSEEDWTEAVMRLSSQFEVRQRIGRAGRATVESDYDISKTVERLLSIIKM